MARGMGLRLVGLKRMGKGGDFEALHPRGPGGQFAEKGTRGAKRVPRWAKRRPLGGYAAHGSPERLQLKHENYMAKTGPGRKAFLGAKAGGKSTAEARTAAAVAIRARRSAVKAGGSLADRAKRPVVGNFGGPKFVSDARHNAAAEKINRAIAAREALVSKKAAARKAARRAAFAAYAKKRATRKRGPGGMPSSIYD